MAQARRINRSMIKVVSGMVLLVISGVSLHGQQPVPRTREQIGEVLGRPVYRDEIVAGAGLQAQLHQLFMEPIWKKYVEQHADQFAPTEREIDSAILVFKKEHQARLQVEEPQLGERLQLLRTKLQGDGLTEEVRHRLEIELKVNEARLEPPGRMFAVFMLTNWKLQKHLYDRFGGGSIMWQQGGMEAIDGFRMWLEAHETQGSFKINNPDLRSRFYEYWKWRHHEIVDDPDEIRAVFLEPEWAPKASVKATP